MACTDKSINNRSRESACSIVLLTTILEILLWLIVMASCGSKRSAAHPNVRLCRDDLSAIQVDHLWSAVGQSSVPGLQSRVMSSWILRRAKTKSWKRSGGSLFDFLLHDWHPVCLRVLEAVRCTSKIAEHVVSPVMQKNILHLRIGTQQETCHSW